MCLLVGVQESRGRKWELGSRKKTRERSQQRKAWLCPVFSNCPASILGFKYVHYRTGEFFFCVFGTFFCLFFFPPAITHLIPKENEKEREMEKYEK